MEPTSNLFELQIDHVTASYLVETAKWNRFLAITWFILCGLILLAIIIFGAVAASQMERDFQGLGALTMGMMVIFYVIGSAIQIIPNIFRYRFATRMLRGIRTNDQAMVNSAFNNLRIYSKYWGIVTIVVVGIYLIFFILAMLGAMVGLMAT